MAAGWDHLIPAWFARLHPRYRTPTNSIYLTGALIAGLLVFSSLGVHAAEAFQVLEQRFVGAVLAGLPGDVCDSGSGGAGVAAEACLRGSGWTSAGGFLATAFTFLLTAYPFVDVVDARLYAVKILGTTLAANVVGYGFYRVRNRRSA